MEEVLDDAGMFVQEIRVSLACNGCACTSKVEKGWQLNWADSWTGLTAENANYKEICRGLCRNYMTVVQKGLFLQKPTMVNYFIFTGSDFVFIALFHCTLYVLHSCFQWRHAWFLALWKDGQTLSEKQPRDFWKEINSCMSFSLHLLVMLYCKRLT